MSVSEDLSRLLAGDLAAEEADALRQRIADEPAVARAWAELQTVVEDLQALPEEAPPPELDARVLGTAPVVPARRWSRWAVPVALAAAALLWLMLRPAPVTQVALTSGDQVVQGRVEVVAGDVRVEVDGLARISVEPDPVVLRAMAAEEEPMKAALSALGGALGGAAVTVAVLQGSAWIQDADGSTVRVGPGETHTVAAPEPRRQVKVQLPEAAPGETPEQAIARLQATVDALTEQLGTAQFTGAVAQGQLVAHVGTPQEWPEEVREGFSPDEMEARVNAILEEHDDVELAELDCSEYPCITVFRPTDASEGWEQRLRPVSQAMAAGLEDVGLSVFASNYGDGDESSSLMGIAIAPGEDADRYSDVGARMHYRADTLMQELGRAEVEDNGDED